MMMKIFDRGQVNSSRTRRRRPKACRPLAQTGEISYKGFIFCIFVLLKGRTRVGGNGVFAFFPCVIFTSFCFIKFKGEAVSTTESFLERKTEGWDDVLDLW